MTPVFIVSSGRCGSMMLANVLALHPELFSVHEGLPYLRPENYDAWSGNKNVPDVCVSIEQKRDWIVTAAERNGLTYVESAHFFSHLIYHLSTIYNARFIHLYRDGRDFVRSGMERKWYTENDGPSILPDTLAEGHRLQPPPEADTRFKKIAWLWNEINSSIVTELNNMNVTKWCRVKLEDFNKWQIRKILNFLQIDASSELLDKMVSLANARPNRTEKEFTIPNKKIWDEDMYNDFMQFGEPMMTELGYL